MTSTQLKYGLGNTTSGMLNKKHSQLKYKQIQIDSFDIQMLSPQFLQSKTLKKPLKQYGLNFNKTNTDGFKQITSKVNLNVDQFYNTAKSFKIDETDLKQTKKFQFTVIDSQRLNVKPAYSKNNINIQNNSLNYVPFSIEDKNTIFSAMAKKGQTQTKKSISFNLHSENQNTKKPSEKVGPAQNKLRKLFNKNSQEKQEVLLKKQQKTNKKHIQEDIHQQISQEYGNQSFQKLSGAYQSAIKQSIKQSIGYSSSGIKQQIVNSTEKQKNSFIAQDIRQSIKISQSKDKISEFIGSYRSSKIQEDIIQDLADSKRKSNNSIEEIYEEVFQQLDESLSKSQSKFKKSGQFKQSDILSKSFRKKNNVVKSIKLAEQINLQNQEGVEQLKKKIQKGSKMAQQILNQKSTILKKKIDLQNFLKHKNSSSSENQNINKNLLYQFKIQLNKLLTGQNFQSKLKRLTSFLNFEAKQQKSKINQLQDKILTGILNQMKSIGKKQQSTENIQKLKKQYEQKLDIMLKTQEINLRIQMDKKLSQKDLQLKKMIAQLQKKFQGKQFSSKANLNNLAQINFKNQQYQIQSDYSIDSENISWKADLWETLPDYQKKKLYEKQTAEVTKFLTNIMISELKEQDFDRQLDISFQFPENLNTSQESIKSSSSSLPTLNISKKIVVKDQNQVLLKTAFNRKQLQDKVGSLKQNFVPDIHRANINKIAGQKKEIVNQYSKIQGQSVIEATKKRPNIKQEVIKSLSNYKSMYLKKKNDIIRKLLKTLFPKKNQRLMPQNFASLIQQMTILNQKDINQKDLLFVRAYEEQLLWSMMNICNKCQKQQKKAQVIQQEIRKQFDRLVVVCQVKTAQNCIQNINIEETTFKNVKQFKSIKQKIDILSTKALPIQILTRDEHFEIIQQKQSKIVKQQLVNTIMSLLLKEFSQEFPKRKK